MILTSPSPFPVREIQRTASQIIPSSLWEIQDPPETLYIQGLDSSFSLLTTLPESGLAIVGTRNPQPRSLLLVRDWVNQLSGSGLVILSGLATGIDAIAHRSALEAGLKTIAFLGAGHLLNYPQENADLRLRILRSGGLVISEYPPDTPALKHHFLRRNRIIATWSKATWVVEAGFRSGALNTARWARDHDRICFAVPGFPGDPGLSGNQTLIDRDHAIPTWGIHSFGVAWLSLATHPSKQACMDLALDPTLVLSADEATLLDQVKTLTLQHRGATLERLLETMRPQDWNSARFYRTLQMLTRKGRIADKFGIWVSI